MQRELVRLAGRRRERLRLPEVPARQHRVVAAEIGRFAHFADRVGAVLARFAREQHDELLACPFDQLGRALEHRGARIAAGGVPRRLRVRSVRKRRIDLFLTGIDDRADRATMVGRIDDLPRASLPYADRGRRGPARCRSRLECRVQRRHRRLVREAQAARIPTFGSEEVARQRQRGIGHASLRAHTRRRIGDDVRDRHSDVADAIDERRVRAVFEEPPYKVRQQVLMAADRGVDTAGDAQLVGGDNLVVQGLAHAVQALEFERVWREPRLFCPLDDRRGSVRVVGGEHREERAVPAGAAEHALRAGEEGHVGVCFAREHRIGVESQDLRPLDLGVPVRAFDQPHRNTQAAFRGERDQPFDHAQRALLIRLYGESQTLPAGERRVAPEPREDFERELESLRFFRVDGHADAVCLGDLRERGQRRRELGENASVLRVLVSGMQRRELDRNARLGEDRRALLAREPDGGDRVGVGGVIARGVGGGQRRLAEHVE